MSIRSGLLSVGFAILVSACACRPMTEQAVRAELPPSSDPAPVPKMAPPPVVVASVERYPSVVAEPETKGEVYPLWYATNRKPNDDTSESLGYSSQSDQKRVRYGKIFVEIPEDYLEELRNESWTKLFRFSSPETKLKVRPPIPLSRKGFFEDIRRELEPLSVDERVAVIYLHGFQTTFEEAAQRAAGIGYQLKIPVTAFFSWPSKGKVAGYEADVTSVNMTLLGHSYI
jgi:esterase/lipase superfamily enzyme